MVMLVEAQGLRNAIKRSLIEWANFHPKYKILWQRIDEPVRGIAFDAIDEMASHRPGTFEVWWATHHNRYVRRDGFTQRQMSLLQETFYAYLSVFARKGLLGEDRDAIPEVREENVTPPRKVKGRR